MNNQTSEPELNTQLLYLSLLQQKIVLLRSLEALNTRIEVFESAFNVGGE